MPTQTRVNQIVTSQKTVQVAKDIIPRKHFAIEFAHQIIVSVDQFIKVTVKRSPS